FAGAGTTGERLAAEAARARVQARLKELQQRAPATEMQFSMPDQWSRRLFVALCRRYGLSPYRALRTYLDEVTVRVIREEIYADASEANEIAQPLASR
ncbi:MAG: hypothetical protein U0Q55_00005, partial [Vicinamibacterales bacterium]